MALWVRVAGRRTSCTEDMPVFCEMCFTPGGIGGQSAAGAASVMLTRGVWQCQVQRLLDLAIGLIFVFGVSAALASMFTELVSCCSTSMCSPSAVPYTANRREHGGKHSGGQRHWLSRQQETARVPGKAPSAVVGGGRGRPADWVGHRPRLPGTGSTVQLDGRARALQPAWRLVLAVRAGAHRLFPHDHRYSAWCPILVRPAQQDRCYTIDRPETRRSRELAGRPTSLRASNGLWS